MSAPSFEAPMPKGSMGFQSRHGMQGRMDIKEACQHRWPDILLRFGVDEKVLNKRNQPCPHCGGTDRFRFTDFAGYGEWVCNQCCEPGAGDGFEFLMRLTGKPFKDVASEIRQFIGQTQARPAMHSDVSKARAALKKTWGECLPLAKLDPVHRYLLSRDIRLAFSELQGLRHHPALPYWCTDEGKPMKVGTFPAMVGLVTDVAGVPSTIHCTYLTPEGNKAAVDPVRKVKPPVQPWKGGAVRLMPLEPEQTLCVAEGIETALAMKTLYPELCPWACISAGNMESFVPPDGNNAIYIAADNDASFTGHAAAYTLAKRLWGKRDVSVLMPPRTGTDWCDVLAAKQNQEAA